jgi:hypothetical protein
METKVFFASSVEASLLSEAKFVQTQVSELVRFLESKPSFIVKSCLISSQDEFGVCITLPNLKQDSTQAIGDAMSYIFMLHEDLVTFRDLHFNYFSEFQLVWLDNIIDRCYNVIESKYKRA